MRTDRERNYISIFYEIVYIIIKILSVITPNITLLFSLHVGKKHETKNINMQITFSL